MSSVVLSISKKHSASLKILVSLVERCLTRKHNHELLGNIPEVTDTGRQSFQLPYDMRCSMLRLACARTENSSSVLALVATALGKTLPNSAHMVATANEHHAKVSVLGFPTQACP